MSVGFFGCVLVFLLIVSRSNKLTFCHFGDLLGKITLFYLKKFSPFFFYNYRKKKFSDKNNRTYRQNADKMATKKTRITW